MGFCRSSLAIAVAGGLLVSATAGITFAQPRTAAPAPTGAPTAESGEQRPWAAAGGDIGIR